jgi:putative solute:sodium symporter small subunit
VSAATTARLESYKKSFALWTTVFFLVWLTIALGVHLPARQLWAPANSPSRLNGAPLNWWMIQISIALGVILAFAYAYTINKLDEKYGIEA